MKLWAKQGYFLDVSLALQPLPAGAHTFGGPHQIAGANCPNCDKPLLRFLSLNTSDARLKLKGAPGTELSLLYCWTCNLAQQSFVYRMTPSDGIEILSFGAGGAVTDFPYPDYPAAFALGSVAFVPVTPEDQKTFG